MFEKIKNNYIVRAVLDSRNLGLYLLLIIALSVTWSSVKIIQQNYQLEKQISQLQLEVAIQEQTNKNQKLKNEYFKTDAYLDWAARKYFGKASPGEKVIVIPPEVASKYTHPETKKEEPRKSELSNASFIVNLQDWVGFFLHHQKTSQS